MTATQRAREAAKTGYSISESIYVPGLYEVRKPDGTRYTVDATSHTPRCSCPALIASCKHVGLLEISRRYWTALERRAAARQSERREEVITITTRGRKILSPAELAFRISQDF